MSLTVEDGTQVANAESYYSVTNTDTYFSSSRGDASTYAEDWTAASTATKEACLRWATRLLDKLWRWDGEQVSTTQALRWPRRYCFDDEGNEITSTTIPNDLKYAVAEMARALLVDASRVDDPEVGLSSLTVGPINLAFDKFDRAGVLPRIVRTLLSGFGTPRSSGRREVERA